MEPVKFTEKTTNNDHCKGSSDSSIFFQPKVTINTPDDVYKQEAHSMAETVIQRSAPSDQTSSGKDRAKFIVEDNLEPDAGQMRKSDFLERLNTEICTTVDETLQGTPYSSHNCPYIREAFARHYNSAPMQLQQLIERYTPATASAQSIDEMIQLVKVRVAVAAARWLNNGGNLSELSDEASSLVPGNPPDEAAGRMFFKSNTGEAHTTESPVSVMKSLGRGSPIDGGTRSKMESAFGTSFSDVEVHTDNHASALSGKMNARAFTVGNHIAFSKGEHQPGTSVGDALIAHELAHVMQQKGMNISNTHSDNALEEDADQTAIGIMTKTIAEKDIHLFRKGIQGLKTGLKISRCSGRNIEDIAQQQKRDLESVSNDPEKLTDAIESMSIDDLEDIKLIVGQNERLGNAIDWDIAFRNRSWTDLLRLHKTDHQSVFHRYADRIQNLIFSGSTNIHIQANGSTQFESLIDEQFSKLLEHENGFRLTVELLITNQTITIKEDPAKDILTDVSGDPFAGRLITTDADSKLLPLNKQHPGAGAGSTVSINQSLLYNQSELSGSRGNLSIIAADPTVTFGHELIHALHFAKGTGLHYPDLGHINALIGNPAQSMVQDPATGSSADPEELHTITGQKNFQAPTEGILIKPNWALSFNLPGDDVTENMLREERNLPKRASHFGAIHLTIIPINHGETVEQMLDRYFLPANLVMTPILRSTIRQLFMELYPYFKDHSSPPDGINDIQIEFPTAQYILMYLRFVKNLPAEADIAKKLTLRQ
ncbi:MAG: DUF4157 domain-containing protein [Bacteroidetes bacterium]|nr:DUF4157 domain-containing protein [Bacteroidota bacterium]